MDVRYLKSFEKDLSKLNKSIDKQSVLRAIEAVKQAKGLADLSGIKKLKGTKHAYRLRVGQFRIGVFIENDVVEFARVLHRKDIYNAFP